MTPARLACLLIRVMDERGRQLRLPVAYRKFQYVIVGAQITEYLAFPGWGDRYQSHFFAAGWARRANGRDVILTSYMFSLL